MKVNIIDPTSTEFNRGSFCYAPYLTYNGIMEGAMPEISNENLTLRLYEIFRAEDLDTIEAADINIVCLWSYPQIEAALLLHMMLPFQHGKQNVYFVGYAPLINHLGLRHISEFCGIDPLKNEAFLLAAMAAYPKYYGHFKRLLLSDCDMHLKHLEKGALVHPLFTTYGCPNGCTFCPSTENCGRKRFSLSIKQTEEMLLQCHEKGIRYIHFTDEDFFFNPLRAYSILEKIRYMDFHLIALGSAVKVEKFINDYGTDILRESGIEVIEIGFESGDEELSNEMGAGKDASACRRLAERQHEIPASIFWLVQTFFPGETLETLNATGAFMRQFGFSEDEVVGRLKTNGTKGGLGQYFQPYHGLKIFTHLEGDFLTTRPIRLMPSYLPASFLQSIIKEFDMTNIIDADKWIQIYNLDIWKLPEVNQEKIGHVIADLIFPQGEETPTATAINNALIVAILARHHVIK